MSYIERSLSTGETIEANFKLHWSVWIMTVFLILTGFLTLGLTWIPAAYLALRIKFQEQGLTNKRVILKRGIISRKTDEMKLKSIEMVSIDQGLIGRLLGYGTVRVTGRGLNDVRFRYINDPMSVKQTIESVANPVE